VQIWKFRPPLIGAQPVLAFYAIHYAYDLPDRILNARHAEFTAIGHRAIYLGRIHNNRRLLEYPGHFDRLICGGNPNKKTSLLPTTEDGAYIEFTIT
jgi:hypothetical protein